MNVSLIIKFTVEEVLSAPDENSLIENPKKKVVRRFSVLPFSLWKMSR